ncbi:MAG: hypothetical protein EBX62_08735, partial [Betaproteobacteria bacterium]|nr:hypothetical protein [Betaproteobacteria bacterium]
MPFYRICHWLVSGLLAACLPALAQTGASSADSGSGNPATAQGNTKRTFTLNQLSGTPDPSASPFFDFGNGAGSSDFTVGRLTASLRRNLAPGTRLEVNSSASAWVNKTDSGRQEFNRAGLLLRSAQEDSRVEEQSLSFTGKLSKVLENDHSLVAGVELAPSWREESKRQSQ